jgi:hypothetical protein
MLDHLSGGHRPQVLIQQLLIFGNGQSFGATNAENIILMMPSYSAQTCAVFCVSACSLLPIEN